MLGLADLKARLGAKPSATVGEPFGPGVFVYKIGGRMFAIAASEEGDPRLTLKCDPVLSEIMRAEHAAITPGYHTDSAIGSASVRMPRWRTPRSSGWSTTPTI